MAGVGDLLEGKRVCICAGSGGVGKTTSSAAIAAGMAARGKKVAVLTIDPAKRLADSLGLPELGNEERRVDPKLFAESGIEMEGGELWAMMLDAKATFDELVRRHAPDAETRERILSNRIYQQLSAALAGSQEYMAMEKLFELHAEDRYDLLVLDTPPSRNAVDFHRKLVEAELPFGGVIVNKVHYESELPPYDDGLEGQLADALSDDDLARRAIENFDDYRGLAARDQSNIKRLTAEMRARLVIQVPYLDADVHDLSGLMQMNEYLFAAGAKERTAIAAEA